MYSEIARLYGKKESSICEVMKDKEKIRATFYVASQTAKVTAIALDKVLLKVQKALNFWLEVMNKKRVPLDGEVLWKKALSLYEDFQKKDGTEEETELLQAEDGCIGLGTGLIPKTLKSYEKLHRPTRKGLPRFRPS